MTHIPTHTASTQKLTYIHTHTNTHELWHTYNVDTESTRQTSVNVHTRTNLHEDVQSSHLILLQLLFTFEIQFNVIHTPVYCIPLKTFPFTAQGQRCSPTLSRVYDFVVIVLAREQPRQNLQLIIYALVKPEISQVVNAEVCNLSFCLRKERMNMFQKYRSFTNSNKGMKIHITLYTQTHKHSMHAQQNSAQALHTAKIHTQYIHTISHYLHAH